MRLVSCDQRGVRGFTGRVLAKSTNPHAEAGCHSVAVVRVYCEVLRYVGQVAGVGGLVLSGENNTGSEPQVMLANLLAKCVSVHSRNLDRCAVLRAWTNAAATESAALSSC